MGRSSWHQLATARLGSVGRATTGAICAVVAILTTMRPPQTGWGAADFLVVVGVWACALLAARELITGVRQPIRLLTFALAEVSILVPFQPSGSVRWGTAAILGLAMSGRLAFGDDRRSERRFLVMAWLAWLSGVAWRIVPIATRSDEVEAVAHEAMLWLAVYLVGRASQAARVNEKRYRAMFNGAPIGLLEEDFTAVGKWLEAIPATTTDELRSHLDRHPEEVTAAIGMARVGAVNPAALALFGAESREEYLQNKPARSIARRSVTRAFIELFVAIWQGQGTFDIAFMGTKVNGDDFPARLGVHFGTTSTGRLDLEHGVIAITDLSRLVNAVEANNDLFAGVSHRLRTPLTSVIGFTRELLETPQRLDDADRDQLLGIIASEADSMANTIEDLLVASRPEITNLMMRMTPIDMAPFLAVLNAKRHIGAGKRLRFGDCDVTICADPARVGQILRNLIDNAVAYGGNEITIEARIDRDIPIVVVADDGSGIADGEADTIFEPHRRSGGDPHLPKSLGLGLSISRRLARAMGGDLIYRRRHNRTEFVLILPSPDAARPLLSPPLEDCPGCAQRGECKWSLEPMRTHSGAMDRLARPAA